MKITHHKYSFKDWVLFSTIFFSYFPIIFYGNKTKVDWFPLIEHTRRIDYYFFYLGLSINYLIFIILLMFPKGIKQEVKQLVLTICILDLLHFVLLSKQYFGFVKVIAAMILVYTYRKYLKWREQK